MSMYANTTEAENYLTGNVSGLGAGKLRYAAWRGKTAAPRNFPQETAEPTSTAYADMFRGSIGRMGALPDEPMWTDVNCNNIVEWFNAVYTNKASKLQSAALLEWAFQFIESEKRKGNAKALDNVGSYQCSCSPSNIAILVVWSAPNSGWFITIANPCDNDGTYCPSLTGVRYKSGNPNLWGSDSSQEILKNYRMPSVTKLKLSSWVSACQCKKTRGTTGCPPPCTADQSGNCMKTCGGGVIRCDQPCEPKVTVPKEPIVTTTTTGPCPCDCNDVQGIQKFYLSRNKTDSSIPVNVNGKTLKCTPRDETKKYSWDCNNVMSQIQSKLQEMKGLGRLGQAEPGRLGPKPGEVATVISSGTPCPCDCVEVDAVIPMYVNLTQTANDDIPFDVPYTSRVCKPVASSSKYNVDCNSIKTELNKAGYSMSGLGDCGCGNCQGQNGLADTQASWPYWLLAGIIAVGGLYFVVKK